MCVCVCACVRACASACLRACVCLSYIEGRFVAYSSKSKTRLPRL